MQLTMVRAVAAVAAVVHHKVFASTPNLSSYDVKPDSIASVLSTAKRISTFIETGETP